MIGIEIITGREDASFGPRLTDFLNKYPNAELMGNILIKGIEGGKGLIAVLRYNKKETPKPKPKKPEKTPEQLEKEAKKAQLEKLIAELEEEE